MRDGIVGRQISRFPTDHRFALAVVVMVTAILLLRLPVGAQAPAAVQAVLEQFVDTQQGTFNHPVMVFQTEPVQVPGGKYGVTSNLTDRPGWTRFVTGDSAADIISVDTDHVLNDVDGFGGSITESSAIVINNSSQRDALLDELFSTSGIKLSYLRQPLGVSGDFHNTAHGAPWDGTNNNSSYSTYCTSNPCLARETPMMNMVLLAKQRNAALKVMGSAWSPPPWMKVQPTYNGSSLAVGQESNLAIYLRKAAQRYHSYGIPLDALTLQNEPGNIHPAMPSMGMNYDQEASVAYYLKEQLNASGLNSVKVLGHDHNYRNWTDESWDPRPSELLLRMWWWGNYPGELYGHVDGIAYHCYHEPEDLSRHADYDASPAESATAWGKAHYLTECSDGGWLGQTSAGAGDGDLYAGFWYQAAMVISAMSYNARAAITWNVALDENHGPVVPDTCHTCRGIVEVNSSTGAFTPMPGYYALGHHSKFAKAGAKHVYSTPWVNGLASVAYKNTDDSYALVVMNTGGGADGWAPRTFTVSWNNQGFVYALPAGAVVTFAWWEN
jgi:glucosylceramidase